LELRSDTTPAGPRELSEIFDATRRRIAALVANLPADATARAVPTVPGATLGDVLAHLLRTSTNADEDAAGLCERALSRPASGHPVIRVNDALEAWNSAAVNASRHFASDPAVASYLVTDAVMCEHDLRTTLDDPGARDDIAVKVALDELSGRFSDRVDAANLSPLRVTVEQWGTIAGAGRAVTCVVADRFEFVRAMSGRRAASEIRRWNWSIEPNAYLSVISETDLPADEIRERDPRIPEHMRDREFVL
jgi:hypothetical protein